MSENCENVMFYNLYTNVLILSTVLVTSKMTSKYDV